MDQPYARVAAPFTGWTLFVAGVLGFVGALGTWADADGAVTYGGALAGPIAAAAAVGGAVIGILVVAGLGRSWVVGLGAGCAVVVGGAAVRGYTEFDYYFAPRAVHAGWGLHLTLTAAILALVAAVVGMMVRRPRQPGWSRPVRPPAPKEPEQERTTTAAPESSSTPVTGTPTFSRAAVRGDAPMPATSHYPVSAAARSELAAPRAGGLMIAAALVGLVCVFGTWYTSLLLPDGGSAGAGDEQPIVLVAVLVALVCGGCIVNGWGGIGPAVVALCAGLVALVTTLLEYAATMRLFIPVSVPDGHLDGVGWGLYGYGAAMLVVVASAVRVVGYRPPTITRSDRGTPCAEPPAQRA